MNIFRTLSLLGVLILGLGLILPANIIDYVMSIGVSLLCIGIIGKGWGNFFLGARIMLAISIFLFFVTFFISDPVWYSSVFSKYAKPSLYLAMGGTTVLLLWEAYSILVRRRSSKHPN